jgi:hypothetical protein
MIDEKVLIRKELKKLDLYYKLHKICFFGIMGSGFLFFLIVLGYYLNKIYVETAFKSTFVLSLTTIICGFGYLIGYTRLYGKHLNHSSNRQGGKQWK